MGNPGFRSCQPYFLPNCNSTDKDGPHAERVKCARNKNITHLNLSSDAGYFLFTDSTPVTLHVETILEEDTNEKQIIFGKYMSAIMLWNWWFVFNFDTNKIPFFKQKIKSNFAISHVNFNTWQLIKVHCRTLNLRFWELKKWYCFFRAHNCAPLFLMHVIIHVIKHGNN